MVAVMSPTNLAVLRQYPLTCCAPLKKQSSEITDLAVVQRAGWAPTLSYCIP